MPNKDHKIIFTDLGLTDYKEAWDYQERLFNEIIKVKLDNKKLKYNEKPETQSYLLFCEHPHVYTLGKSGAENNLLINSQELKEKGASIVQCPTRDGRIDITALMDILGRMDITSLLVEGGSHIIGSMIVERLIDKFYIFKAPKILGGDDGIPMAKGPGPKMIDESLMLGNIRIRRFDDDILISGYPLYERNDLA